MPNEFTVVGEHREDEMELLVKGADGEYYGYRLAGEDIHPVEPDEESWVINHDVELDDVPAAPELRA